MQTLRSTKRRQFALLLLLLALIVGPAFAQQSDSRPLQDAPLSSVLLALDTSQLSGDTRRTFDVLTLIVEDIDHATSVEQRNTYLQEFLNKSQDFVKGQPNSLQIWILRAVAALELNQPTAGREAAQRLVELKAGNLDDRKIRRVLAMLDRKGWFTPERKRPVLSQLHTRPAIFEDNQYGTSNIGPVAFSAKWATYGAYLHRMMEGIQVQWDRILIDSRIEPPSGTFVTIRFTLNQHGKVTEILDVQNDSSEQGKQSCVSAMTMSAPFGEWTDEMIAALGTSQDLTFRFYYE
jgi:hypothetical protein